jgi:hypothetical protein
MSSSGFIALLLVLSACRGSGPPVPDREAGLSALGQYPDLDRKLLAYGDGRRAEIQALERWLDRTATTRSGALDSIGAAAAEIGVESYGRLAAEVDLALVRWRGEGKLDQRLRTLDSLRVKRRVLLVRLMTKSTGSDR